MPYLAEIISHIDTYRMSYKSSKGLSVLCSGYGTPGIAYQASNDWQPIYFQYPTRRVLFNGEGSNLSGTPETVATFTNCYKTINLLSDGIYTISLKMDSYGAATGAENITSTIEFRTAEGASLSANQTTYPTRDTAIITSSITFDTRVIKSKQIQIYAIFPVVFYCSGGFPWNGLQIIKLSD